MPQLQWRRSCEIYILMAFLNREREGKVDDVFSLRHGSNSGEGKRRLKLNAIFWRCWLNKKTSPPHIRIALLELGEFLPLLLVGHLGVGKDGFKKVPQSRLRPKLGLGLILIPRHLLTEGDRIWILRQKHGKILEGRQMQYINVWNYFQRSK